MDRKTEGRIPEVSRLQKTRQMSPQMQPIRKRIHLNAMIRGQGTEKPFDLFGDPEEPNTQVPWENTTGGNAGPSNPAESLLRDLITALGGHV